MMRRCHNPRCNSFSRYGGRGIFVDPAWHDFKAFSQDMGPKPSEHHSLDRIDNASGYRPGNVRWAGRFEQQQNTRRTKMVTAYGITQCVSAWARHTGVDLATLCSRLRKGLVPEAAIEPANFMPKVVTYEGRRYRIFELANKMGVDARLVRERLRAGMTLENALKPGRAKRRWGVRPQVSQHLPAQP